MYIHNDFTGILYSRVLGTSVGFWGGPTDRVGDSLIFCVHPLSKLCISDMHLRIREKKGTYSVKVEKSVPCCIIMINFMDIKIMLQIYISLQYMYLCSNNKFLMQPAGLLSIIFLSKQSVKNSILLVSREREQQSMNCSFKI